MRWLWLLALALPVAGHPMITGVGPDLPGSLEAVAVGSDAPWDLANWTVTDGEGSILLPPIHLEAGAETWSTDNLTAWMALRGFSPAGTWLPEGRFQLANGGDGLRLLDPSGAEVDAFAWGDASEPGMVGSVQHTSADLLYRRDAGWPDTDRAEDWVTPRLHRIGESRLGAPSFVVHEVTLYSSPDSSHDVLSGLIAGARTRLHLHVYELGSLDMAHQLAQAKHNHPDLDLRVLVDSLPVGLAAPQRHEETQALREVQDAGGSVFLSGHARYDYHHLKVLLADGTVAVQSENWGDSGVPRDPTWGNRGWGVAVADEALADWFAAWMDDDRSAWDAEPFDAAVFDPLFEAVSEGAPRTGGYGPIVRAVTLHGDFRVTPFVSPDLTQDPRGDPIAALVDGATTSVSVQQLDLAMGAANDLGWRSADPLMEALSRAAARGVDVRVQAAAPFSSQDAGNQPALDWLAARGVQTQTMDRDGIATLHNKGLVLDGRVAVVGSMNGNHHSRSANREVFLVVEGPDVAKFYQGLFDADWSGARPGPDASVIGRDLHGLPGAPLPSLLAAAGVAAAVLRRRSA